MEPTDVSDPRADVVARQYEKWMYPAPIENLESWLNNNWQWFDPSHSHRLFWPDRSYRPDLDLLVAGCGTNQAAVLAYTNPAAKVVAIDVSQSSLDHHRYLKSKYQLKNLEVHHLPLESVSTLGSTFDLIVSTGVLHHVEDPPRGLQALAECLRPDGVAALMLYARNGRVGVEQLQSVFRELGLSQDQTSLDIVKQALNSLPREHPIYNYLGIAPDLQYDAGLVDTFLHGRDRSYTVDGCLELVKSAGLQFQDWWFKTSYYPDMLSAAGNQFYKSINALPLEKMWAAMESINTVNACHYFVATTSERPSSSYRIDFSAAGAHDYIPLMRMNCGLAGQAISRPGWQTQLSPLQLSFVQFIDGTRSIGDIAECVADSGAYRHDERSELKQFGLDLFETLWRTDFLAIELKSGIASSLDFS